jgi:hypothetical protein
MNVQSHESAKKRFTATSIPKMACVMTCGGICPPIVLPVGQGEPAEVFREKMLEELR